MGDGSFSAAEKPCSYCGCEWGHQDQTETADQCFYHLGGNMRIVDKIYRRGALRRKSHHQSQISTGVSQQQRRGHGSDHTATHADT